MISSLLKDITPSDLNQRVTIMLPRITRDDRGNTKTTYWEGQTLWAYIEVQQTYIHFTYGEQHITQKNFIVFRHFPSIRMPIGAKFKCKDKYYSPISAPTVIGNKYIYVECVQEGKYDG